MTWLSRLDRRCISGHTLGRILLLALKYNRFVIATPLTFFPIPCIYNISIETVNFIQQFTRKLYRIAATLVFLDLLQNS